MPRPRRPVRLVAVLACALVLSGCATAGGLEDVRSRGTLRCGVNNAVPGFGFVAPDGTYSGFDIDFCRVIAAAVLGDAGKVTFEALNADQRFPKLQTGDIDVLVRNTTSTAGRDGADRATFVATTFYDGQGVMVKADGPFKKLTDLEGSTVCVLSGTTTELNLASQFGARGITYEPRSFDTAELIREAFVQGACDAWTSDKSQLAGHRSSWPADRGGPAALTILPDTLSKEPLAPAVRDGDQAWASAVNWAVLATIQAEEFGLTKANVEQVRAETTDPEVRRFLGLPAREGAEPFDPRLGLPVDFAYQVVRQVGSYGEIYEANVGQNTALGLARGVNALWTDGGLLYAPPYR